jgi:hypothetical protein
LRESNGNVSDAAISVHVANKKKILVPGARFAPLAPRNSHSQLRHDLHFGAMYEFSVPQPMALFAYGHVDPNRDGRIRAVSDSSHASDVGSIPIAHSINPDDSVAPYTAKLPEFDQTGVVSIRLIPLSRAA